MPIPLSLIEALARGHVVPFVGSGVRTLGLAPARASARRGQFGSDTAQRRRAVWKRELHMPTTNNELQLPVARMSPPPRLVPVERQIGELNQLDYHVAFRPPRACLVGEADCAAKAEADP